MTAEETNLHRPWEVRPLSAADVPQAAALHRQVFADYFLGHLGQRFLELFYAQFVSHPKNYGWVAVDPRQHIIGCVLATTDAPNLYKQFYRQHFVSLAGILAVRLVADPYVRRHLASRLVHLRYALGSWRARGQGRPAPPKLNPSATPARLLSIGVAPEYRGQGIARALTQHLCAQLRAEGWEQVGLSVRPDNATALAFYYRDGWQVEQTTSTAVYLVRPTQTCTTSSCKEPDA